MSFRGPVLAARDAVALAQFYATVLSWTVADEIAGDGWSWALITSPDQLLTMEFEGRLDYVPPAQPHAAGEQHVYISVDVPGDVASYAAIIDRAVSLGARVADQQPRPDAFTVLLDPAGHSFGLVPTPSA